MKKVLKALLIVIAAAAIVIGSGIVLANNGVENPVSDAVEDATYGAANSALEASGIKAQINKALHENADVIANKTGLPAPMVTSMIDGLDIESWKVAPLPKDAKITGTADIDYGGYSGEITTYDDPSVITVTTDMGSVTLEVPEKAQGYVKYLGQL